MLRNLERTCPWRIPSQLIEDVSGELEELQVLISSNQKKDYVMGITHSSIYGHNIQTKSDNTENILYRYDGNLRIKYLVFYYIQS